MKIYTAEVKNPYTSRSLLFAVEVEHEQDARADLYTAAMAELNMQPGMFRLHDIRRRTRRILSNMQPIAKCESSNGQWAWVTSL